MYYGERNQKMVALGVRVDQEGITDRKGTGNVLSVVLDGGYMGLFKTHRVKNYDLCILLNGYYTLIFKNANKIISFRSLRVATWFAHTKAAQVLQPGTLQ